MSSEIVLVDEVELDKENRVQLELESKTKAQPGCILLRIINRIPILNTATQRTVAVNHRTNFIAANLSSAPVEAVCTSISTSFSADKRNYGY